MKQIALFFLAISLVAFSTADAQQRRRQRTAPPQTNQPSKASPKQPAATVEVYSFRRKTDLESKPDSTIPKGVKIIEGEFNGGELPFYSAQKYSEKQENKEGKITYRANYLIVKDRNIEAIDESGVHASKDGDFLVASGSFEKPLDDLYIVGRAIQASQSDNYSGASITLGEGTPTILVTGPLKATPKIEGLDDKFNSPLVGFVRWNREKQGFLFSPSLEIKTDTGVFNLPVKQLVKFK